MEQGAKRLLIDCTHTLTYGLKTGVQRVVRSIIREAKRLEIQLGVEVVPIIVDGNSFRKVDTDTWTDPALNEPLDFLKHVPMWYKLCAKQLCRLVPNARLRRWLLPDPGHRGVFRWIKRQRKKGISKLEQSLSVSTIGENDVLLLPDAYWAYPQVWNFAAEACNNGAKIAVVIYDLIPITHPQFVRAGSDKVFLEYLRNVLDNADLLIAISKTVRDELRRELPRLFPNRSMLPRVESFRLGAEFDKSTSQVRVEAKQLFGRIENPPYLMVSTFDPRKNHSTLLEAFEILWKTNPKAKLCLVGGSGWMSEDLLKRIKAHSRFGQELFVYHDFDDSSLHYCYSNAKAVVCPSFVEGFNLPIVEALWHGKKLIVSDIPIHREVGGNNCEYFELGNSKSLAAALENWEKEYINKDRSILPKISPITWRESTKEVLLHSLSLCESSSARLKSA